MCAWWMIVIQCKKLEKQVERLRVKVAQQTEDSERLRAENTEMGSLQVYTCMYAFIAQRLLYYRLYPVRLGVVSRRVR